MATVAEDSYVLAKPPPAEKVTYEQFLGWLDENTFGEWVDGEVVPMSAASAQHQDISGFLAVLLRLYAEQHTSALVLAAPFQMRLSHIRCGRMLDPEAKQTDFFVLDTEKRHQWATPDAAGRYESAAPPGFWLNVGWLWRPFLPPPRQVFKEWEAV